MAANPVTTRRGEALDDPDIQALVLQGYGRLRAAAYLVLEVADGVGARAWLAELVGEITTGAARPGDHATNLAFTASGLARLGLPDTAVAGFSMEFQEGMASAHRSRLLGDEGDASPTHWTWGGAKGPSVDVLLLLFARDESTLAGLLDEHRRRARDHALSEVVTLSTRDIGRREHFGFRDGLSQPALAGVHRSAPPMHTVRPGEFLLGYRNEHGEYPHTPLVETAQDPAGLLSPARTGPRRKDFGRNGSYLILRTLSQDVGRFWGFLDEATRSAECRTDPHARTALAARMVGRWPSGAPLTRTPDEDRPELAGNNDFGYDATDRDGLACPIGAHVRRTNPRDSLPPRPGTSHSVDVGKRHRLIRRGRSYGPPIDADSSPAEEPSRADRRGLHFIGLCADIARQFEFITHTWALDPNFAGLHNDADPILGGHQERGRNFTVQGTPVRRRITDIPIFVTVRGGAYFFLPGPPRDPLPHATRTPVERATMPLCITADK